MQLVKIDRETVKRNPNAGSYTENVLVRIYVTFSCDAAVEDWLVSLLQSNSHDHERFYHYKCYDSGLLDKIEQWGRERVKKGFSFSITYHRDCKQIYSAEPAPDWLFSYEDPEVKCGTKRGCGKATKLSEIETAFDGEEYTVCNHCGACNTFEFDLEELDMVLKELSLK